MAEPAGAEDCNAQIPRKTLNGLAQHPAPGDAASQRRQGLFELVHGDRHNRECRVDTHAPERHAKAVIQRQAVGDRRVEIAAQRGVQQVAAECRVTGQCFMRIDGFHERFRRAVMFFPDTDTKARQVVDKEVYPVIR